MTQDVQLPRWVKTYTDGDDRFLCSACAAKRRVTKKKVGVQVTLRYAARTACCVDCREYGKYVPFESDNLRRVMPKED